MKKTLVFAIVAGVMWISSSEVGAVNYYVDATGGNDTNNGQSDATAWRTISKVNNYTFQSGDDVYLKCGGTWTEEYLRVDWAGTSGNRVVIGAYYMDGESEIIGVSGNKPVIDGGTHSTSTLPEQPSGGTYYGLVHVGWRDYITVQNISAKDSRGCGVYFGYSDYGIAENCDVDWIRSSGITFIKSAYGQAIGCTAHNVGIGHKYFGDRNWGYAIGGIAWGDSSSNLIVKNCLVYECWTEGIGLYGIVDNCVVENNLVYDAQKYGIYLDAAQGNIIRYNLVYGSTNPLFHRVGNFVGAGLGVTDELNIPARSENNEFYGNLVANCIKGMAIGANNHTFKDSAVYNNTFVDNGTGISVYVYPTGSFSNSFVSNNIIWQPNVGTLHDVTEATPGLIWSHNNWSSDPESSYVSGSGDVIGVPNLSKTTGWQSLTGGSLNGSDFALQPASPAIDTGTNLGSPYNLGINPASIWPNNVSTLDQNNYGTGWEIGAYVFTGIACLPIDQTNWSVGFVDSEELVEDGGYPAENSFDSDPDTFWSTKWSLPDPEFYHPHEIQIDLGGFYDICGFRYLPRQDDGPGDENGMIKDYEFYVSSDGVTWGTAVASGTWAKDKTEKQVSFDHTFGQYIRLVALNEVEGRAWTTMAELNVLAVQPDTDINDDGKVDLEDFAVLATWWDDENACSLPDWCGGADFNMSGTVDMSDLTYFAENWLRQAW